MINPTQRMTIQQASIFNLDEQEVIDRAVSIIEEKSQQYGDQLSSPELARKHCILKLAGLSRESFLVLFMNAQHCIISSEFMFCGTLDGASVYPREIVTRALQLNASACIFAHNHPSGVNEPSSADRRITQRLQAALALLDIRVLDHFVVAGHDAFSFAESGLF